jgi:hypothetical protein
MDSNGLKVVIRAENTFLSARLELESQGAFAVIYADGFEDTRDFPGRKRVEIDVRFLQQITDSEYLYKMPVDLPEPGCSGPVPFNREGGANLSCHGAAPAETASRLSL